MNRIWFIVLAISLGLNAAMIYERVSEPRRDARHERGERPRWDRRGGENGARFGERMIERRLDHMTERLDLSESQREALRAIHLANLEAIGSRRDSVRALRRALRDALAAPDLDSLRIRSLGSELRSAQAEVESLITLTMIREAALLTPDQRERYPGTMPWDRGERRRRGPPDR